MNTIKSIALFSDEGDILYYEVGKRGVTHIVENTKNGEMALITYYQVYKGADLFCDIHRFDKVEYFIKSEPEKEN